VLAQDVDQRLVLADARLEEQSASDAGTSGRISAAASLGCVNRRSMICESPEGRASEASSPRGGEEQIMNASLKRAS
jgi:hypothetical protein